MLIRLKEPNDAPRRKRRGINRYGWNLFVSPPGAGNITHERFPGDFMFQLTADEKSEVVANCDHLNKLKYSKTLPYAFTEHGAIMAAGVINTEKAIEVSIFIVRAFIKLREMINTHQMLKKKIIEIEARLSGHDEQLTQMVQLLKQMLDPKPPPTKRRIGF